MIEVIRDEKADNSENFIISDGRDRQQSWTNRGHISCTVPEHGPSHVAKDDVPPHLQDKYSDEINDLTPEVLKNLDWLGVDYLIPIGGDDTLSYGVRLYQEGVKVVGIPKDNG